MTSGITSTNSKSMLAKLGKQKADESKILAGKERHLNRLNTKPRFKKEPVDCLDLEFISLSWKMKSLLVPEMEPFMADDGVRTHSDGTTYFRPECQKISHRKVLVDTFSTHSQKQYDVAHAVTVRAVRRQIPIKQKQQAA